MRTCTASLVLAMLVGTASAVSAQPRAEDVVSPEAIVEAAYASIARRPGEPFDWDRFRSLFLPGARLVPNTEQTGGEFRVLTPEEFIAWVDGFSDIESPEDQGLVEEQVAVRIERYGDIAHAFSTYQMRFWDSDEILARGINSFQLVRNADRWWIAGIVWDDESGAGPIPGRYLPDGVDAGEEAGR